MRPLARIQFKSCLWRSHPTWRNVIAIAAITATLIGACELPASADAKDAPRPGCLIPVASAVCELPTKCPSPLDNPDPYFEKSAKNENDKNNDATDEKNDVQAKKTAGESQEKAKKNNEKMQEKDPALSVLMQSVNDGMVEEEFILCNINYALNHPSSSTDMEKLKLEKGQADALLIARKFWGMKKIEDEEVYAAALVSNTPATRPEIDFDPTTFPDLSVLEGMIGSKGPGGEVKEVVPPDETKIGNDIANILFPYCGEKELPADVVIKVGCGLSVYSFIRSVYSMKDLTELVNPGTLDRVVGSITASKATVAAESATHAVRDEAEKAAGVKGFAIGAAKTIGKGLAYADLGVSLVVSGIDIYEMAKSQDYSALADVLVDGVAIAAATIALLAIPVVGAIITVVAFVLGILVRLLKTAFKAIFEHFRNKNAPHAYYGIPADQVRAAFQTDSYPGDQTVHGSDTSAQAGFQFKGTKHAFFLLADNYRHAIEISTSTPTGDEVLKGYAVQAFFIEHLLALGQYCGVPLNYTKLYGPGLLRRYYIPIPDLVGTDIGHANVPRCSNLLNASLVPKKK